ncbi:uncharacterized protein DUF3159 [Actinomycetospora succinea]|uniref:Uncharacterized protein DUF3159 n=1 Tax=Actinomycetospora succinea TaxID=663603 RepID=A0A4R6VNI3_9PSEU|nr:DUF3159 domain-containing protein [Actinomycetospora succinea]TDQ65432.1 uncharacterized protein DUF3159 [Actinomycetospora succinea]
MIIEQTRPVREEHDAVTAPVPVARPEDVPTTAIAAAPPTSPGKVILEQMGGWPGVVYTNVPAIVFSIANASVPLLTSLAVAMASAVALAVFRLTVRREKLVSASGGIIGVAFAGAITVWTGTARDFFLVGIWLAFAATVVLVGSLVVRRPVTGMAWSWLYGTQFAWREDRGSRRAHDVATAFAAVVFAGRFAVNQWLYLADSTGGLAAAKVVTGFPLTALMGLVVIWAFRRTTKRLIKAR